MKRTDYWKDYASETHSDQASFTNIPARADALMARVSCRDEKSIRPYQARSVDLNFPNLPEHDNFST